MTFCIAFHSYKGGTGKTTIASNLSIELAKQGNTVVLLDMDLYSPSLSTYFDLRSENWINDFLYSSADIKSIIKKISMKEKINNFDNHHLEKFESSPGDNLNGKLFIALANSTSHDFKRLDVSGIENQKHYFHKLVSLRDLIISKYNPDYIILDTSPGVRYWSLSALAISDIFLLTLKMGDIDIQGTRVMIREIYNSFINTGTKSFLLLNKVAGYCVPHASYGTYKKNLVESTKHSNVPSFSDNDHEENNRVSLSHFELDIISHIPCFCDIQFSKREYLTSYYNPEHPFSHKMKILAKELDKELKFI
jgi:chromosome partitioning protein